MRRRCPDSRPLQAGCLEGYRLDFGHYSSGWNGGTADVVADPNHEVWGLIYDLSEEDLQELDNYEGYPEIYTRFQTDIQTRDRRIVDVWVYAVVDKKEFVHPATAYLEIIKKAAIEYNFPEKYRSYLEAIEVV
jgi:gamma-glutamylcyclotransferase (GGCT)/AIG2-like uncharacterized protein YtfP